MFDKILVLLETINLEELKQFTVQKETMINELSKFFNGLHLKKRKETSNLFMELVREKLRFKNGQSN